MIKLTILFIVSMVMIYGSFHLYAEMLYFAKYGYIAELHKQLDDYHDQNAKSTVNGELKWQQ